MTPSQKRQKALKFVQEVCSRILEHLPDFTTKDCYAHLTSKPGVDFHMSKELLYRLPLAPECKFHKKINVHEAMRQAEEYRSAGTVPVVFFRQAQSGVKRPKILVALDMDDFLDLVL